MELDELLGKRLDFYGVDGTSFKLGEVIFDAVEDESDGYRSMLKCVRVMNDPKLIFFETSVAKVGVEKIDDGYFDGYELRDVSDGHLWLAVGTSNYDDYYPCFTFDYSPRPPASESHS